MFHTSITRHIILHFLFKNARWISILCLSMFFVVDQGSVWGQETTSPSNTLPTDSASSAPVSQPLNALREGRSSLSFQLPYLNFNFNTEEETLSVDSSTTVLGFWHNMSKRFNVGMNLGISVSQDSVIQQQAINGQKEVRQDLQSTHFIFSPAFKYYTRTQSSVALYFLGQAHFSVFSDGDPLTITDSDAMGDDVYNPEEDPEFALIFGFGTEWFPTSFFSIGGHVGLRMDLFRQGYSGFSLSTFTSNLTAQIYF